MFLYFFCIEWAPKLRDKIGKFFYHWNTTFSLMEKSTKHFDYFRNLPSQCQFYLQLLHDFGKILLIFVKWNFFILILYTFQLP